MIAATLPEGAWVALITTAGSIIALFVTYLLRDRKGRTEVQEALASKIGTPNGKGNVVQMLELILVDLGDIKRRLSSHDERLQHVEQRMIPPAIKFVPPPHNMERPSA
mgnify:FL=1